jgi:uncharacterized protein (TIGR00255 family)
MRQSMTGFATRSGAAMGQSWLWDLRGVNNRGLDLRLRLPEAIEGLEPLVRKAAGARLARGSIQVSLRLASDGEGVLPRADPRALEAALEAIAEVETAAAKAGVTLVHSSATSVLTLRGVMASGSAVADPDALRAAVMADFEHALDAFVAARQAEGARLAELIAGQLDTIETHVAEAAKAAAARAPRQAERLKAQVERVTGHAEDVDPDRIAQELALIAVKADVTEEIDRLGVHVAAARGLLAEKAPVGRRLDFLCQEFNREANTLCSKSGDAALTTAGLALKTVIEQMREQIQNVE